MARAFKRRRRMKRRPDQQDGATTSGTRNASVKTKLTPLIQPGRLKTSAFETLEAAADRTADRALSHGPDGVAPANIGAAPATAQMKADPSAASSAVGAKSVSPTALGPGRPLETRHKKRYSGPLGDPLDHARIDTSATAHRLTSDLSARAVTIGNRVGFAKGEFSPRTRRGAHLLAHELAHTVQQKRSGRVVTQLKPAAKTPPKAQHGFPGVEGGLINDAARRRMNVIVRKGDTLLKIAAKLLPYWKDAESGLTAEQKAALPAEIRTAEGIARAILVHHRYYLVPPAMTKWRDGLRLPLPMLVLTTGGPPVLNVPKTALWLKSFDPKWEPLLSKKAGDAVLQTELSQEDKSIAGSSSSALGLVLGTKAMSNAKESLPLFEKHLGNANLEAGNLALAILSHMVNHQLDVLSGQASGQQIITLLRKAIEANRTDLAKADQDGLKRSETMLKNVGAAFGSQAVEALKKAYQAQSGNHCMTACYMGLGKLYGADAKASVKADVRAKDKASPKNLDHVITIMTVLQEQGRAGAPATFRQVVGGTRFDKDPDAFFRDETARLKSQPGVYFYGMSAVTGYHTVMLALDLTNADTPVLYWLDQHTKKFKTNMIGKIAGELRDYAASARSRNPKYSPLETKIWPLYPPSQLIVPVE